MKRFKNILYFADGAVESCSALERAIALTEANQAHLTVIDVIEEYAADQELEKRLGVKVEQLLHDKRIEELTLLIEPHQNKNTVIDTHVMSGIAFVEVIQAIFRNNFDLLIKPSRPTEGLAEHLLGSTDQHLLRKCPCPVWIEQPNKQLPYSKIVAAIDPMGDHNDAGLIMELATSLACQENAKLEVLHAWHLPGESTLRTGITRISQTEIDMLVSNEEEKHRLRFNSLLEKYNMNIGHPDVILVKGVAATSICKVAETADLIVMGTVGRNGIQGLFVGNTAEDVMQNTKTSILAVKPEGFRSPLK